MPDTTSQFDPNTAIQAILGNQQQQPQAGGVPGAIGNFISGLGKVMYAMSPEGQQLKKDKALAEQALQSHLQEYMIQNAMQLQNEKTMEDYRFQTEQKTIQAQHGREIMEASTAGQQLLEAAKNMPDGPAKQRAITAGNLMKQGVPAKSFEQFLPAPTAEEMKEQSRQKIVQDVQKDWNKEFPPNKPFDYTNAEHRKAAVRILMAHDPTDPQINATINSLSLWDERDAKSKQYYDKLPTQIQKAFDQYNDLERQYNAENMKAYIGGHGKTIQPDVETNLRSQQNDLAKLINPYLPNNAQLTTYHLIEGKPGFLGTSLGAVAPKWERDAAGTSPTSTSTTTPPKTITDLSQLDPAQYKGFTATFPDGTKKISNGKEWVSVK